MAARTRAVLALAALAALVHCLAASGAHGAHAGSGGGESHVTGAPDGAEGGVASVGRVGGPRARGRRQAAYGELQDRDTDELTTRSGLREPGHHRNKKTPRRRGDRDAEPTPPAPSPAPPPTTGRKIVIDDKNIFCGDGCPRQMVKVNGKCVDEY